MKAPAAALPAETASAVAVVQAQLDAYNAKDIEALLRTYAADAEQLTLRGERLACGHEQIRARFLARFSEPDLHAMLLSRVVIGDFVIDAELIVRNFSEGRGTLKMLCIYEVIDGVIQTASFATGVRTLLAVEDAAMRAGACREQPGAAPSAI